MSDDRRFEREARAWLELGPTDAPDRVVEAALIEIDSTSQQRDLGARWRLPIMSMASRMAAVAVVAIVAVGAAMVFSRPGPADVGTISPSPSSSAVATRTVAAFKSERDAICQTGLTGRTPLEDRYRYLFDPAASDAQREDGIAALDAFIALDARVLDELAAIQPPEDLREGHITNVAQFRDVLTLLSYESQLLHDGDFTAAAVVDRSTDELILSISGWERQYNLESCP